MARAVLTLEAVLAALLAAGCAGPQAAAPLSDSKAEISPEALPAGVRAAALAAEPGLTITEAEHEVRQGKDYYDVGGRTPGGAEVEFDITQVNGAWTVVERQRDITLAETPAAVKAALFADEPGFPVNRVIESDQGGGVVIYEFFAPGPDGKLRKKEVKYAGGKAELLTAEWVH